MTWNLFSKKKKTEGAQTAAPEKASGKGRPTPKRRDAQKGDLRPLVPTQAERKARRKEEKQRLRERQDREYEAMETGDLAHMPRAERLPIRIYVRDYVDARWNIAEFFVPVALGIMILALILMMVSPLVSNILTIIMYVYLIAAVVDLILMWWAPKNGLRTRLITKYGEGAMKSARCASYACSRALQLRRWRLPKPRAAKRGQWPK
jgi:hypothetical protein